MKTIILVLHILFVVFVTCDIPELKKYPKMQKGIKIYNPRKFQKLKHFKPATVRKEIYSIDNTTAYTVFSPVYYSKQDVPNSPYFTAGQNVGLKPRVKKVLSEFEHSIRKRSANITIDERKEAEKIDKVDIVTRKPKKSKKRKETKTHVHKEHHHHETTKTKDVKKKRKRKEHSQKPTHSKTQKRSRKKKSNRSKKEKSVRSNKERHHVDKTVRSGKVRNRRLIASRDAMIEDYPYVVSIQKAGYHWCSGALLNQRLVITTANCIWKSNRMSRLKVRAGSRYLDRGGQVARVQEVMKHPYWSIRKNPDYDVGLLLLDRNIKFSDSTHAVDLPNIAMYPAFEDAWVASWGAERRDGVFEDKGNALQVYHARLMDKEKCNNVTMRFGVVVTNNFICLAQTGKRAPCTRDTGAPAVSDGILWGLASWGLRKLCGTERYPAMFSYLGSRSNLDFITNATHYLMSDQRYYAYPDKFVLNKADTTEAPTTSHMDYK